MLTKVWLVAKKSKSRKSSGTAGSKSFSQELSAHFSELSDNASRALERLADSDDPEALHDLRISLRSQRVLLGLFPRCRTLRKQRDHLGMAARLTGLDRDLEVAIGLAESLVNETKTGEQQLSFLTDKLSVSRKKLLTGLQDVRLPLVLSQVDRDWSKKLSNKRKSVLQSAARAQNRKFEKRVLITAADLQMTSPVADWHLLRLQVKRLRYWGEGFASVLTENQCRRIPALIALQQRLGLLHDFCLFESQFQQELILPEPWQQRLEKWQQNALADAAGMLQHLKMRW
nr:CHAD domain-containing protein [Tolumonas osonensis]